MQRQRDLEKIDINRQATRLTEPFTMIDLAQVDDLVVSIFLCQGTLPFHRHLDQDELFLVHSGSISLDSDWGTVILHPGELSVVPKSLRHRSSSLPSSLVLLVQGRLAANRRNGDRRLFALKGAQRLEKASLSSVGSHIAVPFRPIPVAHVDTFALELTLCQDTGPWRQQERQASLILCYQGEVFLDSEIGRVSLSEGELTIVPKGITHRLTSNRRALVVGLQRHLHPSLAVQDPAS